MHLHYFPRPGTGVLQTTQPFVPWPYIDDLYDYMQILSADRPIGVLPPDRRGAEVAIIGAGVAGMVAAYELLRLGLRPVVFEATGRVGGRGWSRPFTGAAAAPFAELGAMRFPASDRVFAFYARDLFRMQTIANPEPGAVPTLVYYDNQPYWLQPGSPLPAEFQRLSDDWRGFFLPLIEDIYAPWQQGELTQVRQLWQTYITRYKNVSLYEAITQGIPTWTPADLALFGATGAGGGGLGTLYDVGFLEVLRMYIRFLNAEQHLFRDGINGLTQSFYTHTITLPGGEQTSLQALDAVRFQTPVVQLARGPRSNPTLTYSDPVTHDRVTREFPAVIAAASIRALQVLGLTLPDSPLAEPARAAARGLRLMNSAKLYIRTATKFWRERPGLPQYILTDELPVNVFVLDYPQTENGVVLLSYTWGPDADKVVGLDIATQFALFKEAVRAMHPEFASYLVPLDDEIVHVDWVEEPHYYGAYKLLYPGQDAQNQAAYYQFLSALDPAIDAGVYLAGESVSWQGGWTESALHTGLNAASAAAHRLGAALPPNSPLSVNPALYTY
ncbi:MAG: flavin monoamine oxidase family protein [Thermomicrobiales bacterium]